MPRKSAMIGFRAPQEVAEALEQLENKSEYIVRLVLDDLAKNDGKISRMLKKEEHIRNVTVFGRVSNSIARFRSMERTCTSAAQKRLLKREMIGVLSQEMEMATNKEIKEFIETYIKEFQRL